jgi:hypothetical protein
MGFNLPKEFWTFLAKALNSQVALCVCLTVCLLFLGGGVFDRMDRITFLVQEIKVEHKQTPDILAQLRKKIEELCGQCRKCKKAEVNGSDG